MSVQNPEEKIIIALDSPSFGHAFSIVLDLREKISHFKIGPILFLSNGTGVLEQLRDLEVELFLDLKFHDIPSTVEKTIEHVVGNGIKMFTIHSLGGYEMMSSVSRKVKEEAEKTNKRKPLVFAVTMLTSHNQESLSEIGIEADIKEQVLRLAGLAEKSGVDGIVCSGHEVEFLKKEFGERFQYIVPGIRLDKDTHDQQRVVTPSIAFERGADFIVVGRSVTQSPKPIKMVDRIIDSLK